MSTRGYGTYESKYDDEANRAPMHGWWVDGEYVPCMCDTCALDRDEAEERTRESE